MRKKKNKRKYIGICTSIILLTLIVMIASFVFSILGINGNKTIINNGLLESTLITTNNIFSVDGLKYILGSTIDSFRCFEPLIILIISIISVGILEKSGFLHHIFIRFNKLKMPLIVCITIIVTMLFGFFGEYSFVVLIPFVIAIYKTMNKNPVIGIITVFLAGIFGYGISFLLNSDLINMSTLTQASATLDVDPSYVYNQFSTLYISIFYTIVLIIALTILINTKIVDKLRKTYLNEEIIQQTSKKGMIISIIIIVVFAILSVLLFLPKTAMVDQLQTDYTMSLFGETSTFKNGLIYIMLLTSIVVGSVYGRMSKNFKNDIEINLNLSGDFDKIGMIFIIMFLSIQLKSILDYTNIGVILITGFTNFISNMELTGVLLLGIFIILNIIVSFIVPGLLEKWTLMSPIIVPLFMRANMAPEFCQFVYLVSGSIGRILSPLYVYFLIMIGYLNKFSTEEKDITIVGVIKIIAPTVLIVSGIMILCLFLWYISGLPIGLSGYPTF